MAEQHHTEDSNTDYTGKGGGNGNAAHAQRRQSKQTKHKSGVQHSIEQVHDGGDVHRDAGVSVAAQDGSDRVEQ